MPPGSRPSLRGRSPRPPSAGGTTAASGTAATDCPESWRSAPTGSGRQHAARMGRGWWAPDAVQHALDKMVARDKRIGAHKKKKTKGAESRLPNIAKSRRESVNTTRPRQRVMPQTWHQIQMISHTSRSHIRSRSHTRSRSHIRSRSNIRSRYHIEADVAAAGEREELVGGLLVHRVAPRVDNPGREKARARESL